ncbi:MAG TPA: ATP-binding protein [Gemmatimonadaceae bacterium]|jgi:nitrogen fixation/metabolism regulation signal transduction histidine kinase
MASEARAARPWRYESRLLAYALLAGLPAVLATLLLLFTGDHAVRTVWTVAGAVVLWWLLVSIALRDASIHPVNTVANLLAALREGDFSVRGRGANPDDALGLALYEVNALRDTLREQRLGAIEASALLRCAMEEIDVALFAFDDEEVLVLANRAGEQLLRAPSERLIGQGAGELGLADFLREDLGPGMGMGIPGVEGRWVARRSTFRQRGHPMQLLVLTEVGRVLREEERQAWQRIVRVIGHEINNSLAPISSIAASLAELSRRDERPVDWDQDLRRGLDVIAGRSEALTRFMAAYARLARLPAPRRTNVDVPELVRRVAALETRASVKVVGRDGVHALLDVDQIEQALINLVANAVDATREMGGDVAVCWEEGLSRITIRVVDDGSGVPQSANLFVPFFTTKPSGSGIGLALCRQIAEGHGGSLVLRNRVGTRGAEAVLVLPKG